MTADSSTSQPLDELAVAVRAALDSADLGAIGDLLTPDAHWGSPDDTTFDCRNKDEVVAWWSRSRAAGADARVTEVICGNNKLLVGLAVTGTEAAQEIGGEADRWQVLTVRDGLIADIRGFEDRALAAARAGIAG